MKQGSRGPEKSPLWAGTRLGKGSAGHMASRGGGGCHEVRGPRLLRLNRGFENQGQGDAADLGHVLRGAGVGRDPMRGWETVPFLLPPLVSPETSLQ